MLMATPQWGEHRARYWLDVARYADTHGIHFDNYREIWTYRDWVINAFNKNERFDQFTIDQLAGDLLPNPTVDKYVATGFNRCNITSNEGGLIPEEYLVLYTRDRTETTARVWLGLTAGCAVCHDHKFDPLSQKEFYSLSAFFNNTTQAAMDGNIKDTPPVMLVPTPEDRPRWDAVKKELPETQKLADARKAAARGDFDKWLTGAAAGEVAASVPTGGLRVFAPLSEGDGKVIAVTVDGKPRQLTLGTGFGWDAGHVAAKALRAQPGAPIEVADAGDFDKDQGFSYGAWVKLTKSTPGGAVFARMDDLHDFRGWDLWVQNDRVGAHIIDKWPNDALKVVSKNPVKVGQWNHLFISYDGSGKASGVHVYVNGVAQETTVEADRLAGTIRTTVPLTIAQRHTTSRLDGAVLQDLRIYGRALSPEEVGRLARSTRAAWLAQKPAAQRTEAEKSELFDWWLPTMDPAYQGLAKKVSDLQQEEAAIKARGSIAYVMQERPEPATAYVLFRGDYDKRREKVTPATPAALHAMAGRPAAQPARVRRVADAAGEPADGPRHGQPLLAAGVRDRHRPHQRGLRRHRRRAVEPGAARLAGGRVPRVGLGRETYVQADRHVGGLPAVGRGHEGEAGEGPGQPADLARPALPHGRRDDPRLRPGVQRPAGEEDRRPEREAVPARRACGRPWP